MRRSTAWTGNLICGGLLLGAWALASDFTDHSDEPYLSQLPLGLSALMPVPGDNPLTKEKVELGRRLFFDKGLSGDGSLSCASCHLPDQAFADGRATSIGIEGRLGRRSAPTLVNAAYRKSLFWDGRRKSLEEQALDPIENPIELGNSVESVLSYVNADEGYPAMFELAFGTWEITAQHVAQALASFERTILSGDTAYDRYVFRDDPSSFSESALRGLEVFNGKARCSHCHEPPLFSDQRFHNTGVSWGQEPPDLGRYELTGLDEDRGKFKTPTLRDIARTAPYMHNGSVKTLKDVVDFYNDGGQANPNLDPTIRPLNLTEREKTDLIAFLESLTGKPVNP